jgi:hypothetical protein
MKIYHGKCHFYQVVSQSRDSSCLTKLSYRTLNHVTMNRIHVNMLRNVFIMRWSDSFQIKSNKLARHSCCSRSLASNHRQSCSLSMVHVVPSTRYLGHSLPLTAQPSPSYSPAHRVEGHSSNHVLARLISFKYELAEASISVT